MSDRLFSLACKVAAASSQYRRHGAIIARGSRVISVGVNSAKTHPKAGRKGRHIHAELAAIIASGSHVQGATLYSARVLSDGSPGLSRPCVHCSELLRAYGVKYAVFHDGENVVKMRVSEL